MIIDEIKIEQLRSIEELHLKNLRTMTALVGKNSTGKSNVLRALNLFFNGETEAGIDFNFHDEISTFAPKGKKKFISVAVHFDLMKGPNYKKYRNFVKKYGDDDGVWIQKLWHLGERKYVVEKISAGSKLDDLSELDREDEGRANSFVQSIRFRYIENNVDQSALIDDTLARLRPLVAKEWSKEIADSESLMGSLQEAADRMLSKMFPENSLGSVADIRAEVAEEVGGLVFDLGIRVATRHGDALGLHLQGAGIQSFILLHLLLLMEKRERSQQFGWRQGTIIAYEEPESFLHEDLKISFSRALAEAGRLRKQQVIITTHSEDFASASDAIVLLEKGAGPTRENKDMAALNACEYGAGGKDVHELMKRRVISFKPPLLRFLGNPIVLVEGKIDKLYLTRAVKEAGIKPRWKIVEATQDYGYLSGGSAVKKLLQEGRAELATRPDDSFIVVLRDWEDKIADYEKLLNDTNSVAWCCDVAKANPELDESFKGIERYLPTDVVKAACDGRRIFTNSNDGSLRVDPKEFQGTGDWKKSPKGKIYQMYLDDRDLSIGKHMVELVKWIDKEIEKKWNEETDNLIRSDRWL